MEFLEEASPYKDKEFCYLDVFLEFDRNYENEIDENHFKCIVVQALQQMFGIVGSAIDIDVLKYREKDKRAFLRCPGKKVEKVRIALTIFSSYENVNCCFRINKVTPDLTSLSKNT
ncbi:ribonuclease P protein subunit p14 [Centruroides vittatus]|uniref:ribonuclease P protein subunit p14 n=1 Tax=Centruroides vittatus TaxID=120091 RepID=UPI00350FCF68